jgi:hypothetical protein
MSESKARKDRKMSIVTEEADPMEVAKEMAASIRKMIEDRDNKANGAKEHLVSQLEVTVDKYRTANGVMSALDTVRTVFGSNSEKTVYSEIQIAQRIAKRMAVVTADMAKKAGELDPDEMDKLCDGFYDKDIVEKNVGPEDLAQQLMILNLCQNVGPNAGDVSDFCRTADQEIDKARDDLKEHCEKNGINFNELCGPHDRCPVCLCADCAKDCKEGKEIMDGQSAYDVCPDFEAIED